MRHFAFALCLAGVVGTAAVAPASATMGRNLCVQTAKPQCYPTVQAALDAAHDGDTVKLGAGSFAGGVTITKSISLVGAGAGSTVLSGGGPVLTIGVADAASEPTVTIAAMTITGGENHGDGPFARGGGIAIPAAAGSTTGATVKISHVKVSGNRAEPTVTVASPGGHLCPGGPCPFAAAYGGGIYSAGTLTVNDSTITDNLAGGLASDAEGGGIWSALGSVSVTNSLIAGNRSIAVIPNGRFANGGGIFVQSGSLSMKATVVRGNSAQLTSSLPSFAGGEVIEMGANSGGIFVGDNAPTLIANTIISGNTVSADNPTGEALGIDAAMLVGDSPLTMRNTQITGNDVTYTVATTADVGPGGSTLELDGGGTITNTRITGNHSTAISADGVAAVNGALAILDFSGNAKLVTVQDSVISGNTAEASSTSGTAVVQGAGIFNNSLLLLRRVQVSRNSGSATGPAGASEGGGIWHGVELSGPNVALTLENSMVTGNTLTGSPGVAVRGGGLFTNRPVTLTRSLIARNAPDQCFGC